MLKFDITKRYMAFPLRFIIRYFLLILRGLTFNLMTVYMGIQPFERPFLAVSRLITL
jgi:hypothetical protein